MTADLLKPGELPPAERDLLLGNKHVRVLGTSPKGRHVHFEVLMPRRRKNQAPRRGWMPLARFLCEAKPCGYFRRAPSGELCWIEPEARA